MSGVFRNIDPPPPDRPVSVDPSAFGAGGGHTRWVERRGWGVNCLEDARHCSVLHICKYFVVVGIGQVPLLPHILLTYSNFVYPLYTIFASLSIPDFSPYCTLLYSFIYRRPTLYPLEIAVDFLKSL